MNLKASFKKKRGLIFSTLLHLLLLMGAIHTLDRDRYRPTSTEGYQVELVHNQDTNQSLPSSPGVINPGNSNVLNTPQSKAEINLKEAAQEAARGTKVAAKRHLEDQQHKQQELHAKQIRKKVKDLVKTQTQSQVAQSSTGINTPQVNSQPPDNQEVQHQGVAMTNKNQEQIVASAPTGEPTTVGEGDATNSSTDGNGTQDGTFDFRVIEYGRDAADVIKQNIVVPQSYQYTHVTYRAFVVLDRNMQFQSMQLVKSTGSAEYDANIAKALRQTIYPPLPSGANWNEFHNIDFTIK